MSFPHVVDEYVRRLAWAIDCRRQRWTGVDDFGRPRFWIPGRTPAGPDRPPAASRRRPLIPASPHSRGNYAGRAGVGRMVPADVGKCEMVGTLSAKDGNTWRQLPYGR